MPTSSSKKKTTAKKAGSRSTSTKTTKKAAKSSRQAKSSTKTKPKAKAKKATKAARPARAAKTAKATKTTKTKKTKTAKVSASPTASLRRKTPAKVTKPIRIDYLLEKLQESHGPFGSFPVPSDSLDVLALSFLGQHLSFAETLKAFQGLKNQFVDWNEVRISSAGEVREVLKGAIEPLELAISFKAFLQSLFLEQHHVGLEFLREKSNPEIRSFFKKHPVFSESTIILMLERINEYPVVPLENYVQTFLDRVGLGGDSVTPLQRMKDLYEKVSREHVLALHVMLHDQGRLVCPTAEEALDCPECPLKRGCPYPAKVTPRQRAAILKSTRK